jgi:hypothetical protein
MNVKEFNVTLNSLRYPKGLDHLFYKDGLVFDHHYNLVFW